MKKESDKAAYFRWNVDPTWHHFCSIYQEAYFTTKAPHEFATYHHLRGCLYFAVGAIESFLNKEMRTSLKAKGATEEEIYKEIRNAGLGKKIKEWPQALASKEVKIPAEVIESLLEICDFRNEITHPKHVDHGIYKELDQLNVGYLTDLIATYIVVVHEALGKPYPYWTLGWNFIGMNTMTQPALLNVMNGFIPSLRTMGYNVPSGAAEEMEQWQKRFMTTLEGYKTVKEGLDKYSADIEPFVEFFPMKPRLTRRWWDEEYLKTQFPSKT